MIAGLHVPTSFRAFKRSRLTRVAMAAVILMPLLYSALYLWAFWNPFGNVNHLPVALVNSDEGTVVKGEPLHAGDQVVAGLLDNDKINWTETTAADAREGVANGTYYFSLELPPNFSQAVASPASGNPEKAQLIATYNDSNGYLSSVIGQNVMNQVLSAVSTNISAEAVDKVLIGVADAGSGLQRAAIGASSLASGAGELRDGAAQLDDGSARLADGLGRAKDGSAQLASGSGELVAGMTRLDGGASQLADGTQQLYDNVTAATGQLTRLTDGTAQLRGGIDQLGAGARDINAGVQELKTAADRVTAFQSEQSANLRALADQLRPIANPDVQRVVRQLDDAAIAATTQGLGPDSARAADIARLADGTAQLAFQLNDPAAPLRAGVEELASGSARLPGKIGELQDGVTRLNDGAHQLRDGIATATAGATRLQDGAQQLDAGNAQLLDGARQLHDGTGRLSDGTVRLSDGAQQLADGLRDGANQVPHMSDAQRLRTAATVGGPVTLAASNDSGQNTFGAGLAPFFFSLALFIGGIITYTLLNPLQARAISSGLSGLRAAIEGFIPAGILAIGQAVVMIGVTVWAVGLHAGNLPGLFAFAVLVSIVYMLVNQMIIAVFGPGPGRVLALGFLMLQLISSGGIYPVETQNRLMQALHPFNPMTYAVNGFRQLTYGFYDERLPIAILVLCMVGAVALAVTAFSARRQRLWTMKRLHPVLKA